MSFGHRIRKLLGPGLFPFVGRFYRSIFINLVTVAESFPEMRADAEVLDIGGGDGEVINRLLERFPHCRITMIDIAESVGTSIKPEFKNQVSVLPNTSLKEYCSLNRTMPDYIILSCVIHHIPPADRPSFFEDLKNLVRNEPVTIVVLEVEPGYFRSYLGFLSDKYITGEKKIAQVGKKDLVDMMKRYFPRMHFGETSLFKRDKPNYCLFFAVNDAPRHSARETSGQN